jgi:hypothetical protein
MNGEELTEGAIIGREDSNEAPIVRFKFRPCLSQISKPVFRIRELCLVLAIVCLSSQPWITIIKEDTWCDGEREDVLVRLCCGSLGWCFVARHEVRLNLKQEALSWWVGMF